MCLPFLMVSCDGGLQKDNSISTDQNIHENIIFSEASSVNLKFVDEDGDTPDWFEIVNDGAQVVNLEGWSVTDDVSELSKWIFPNVTLRPDEYLRIWASKKDRKEDKDHLHTNFKLSSKGETLILSSPAMIKDSLEVFGLTTDVSVGRSSLDRSLVYYALPSPGRSNGSVEFDGVVQSNVSFSHQGGEFYGRSLSLGGVLDGETIRYTTDASLPTLQSEIYQAPIDINENTVIRTRIFKDRFIPSNVESRTYITSQTHDLPIVTLVTERKNFFDHLTGIYVFGPEENYINERPYFNANFWQDWERDIHFSFYEESGELGIALDAGVKIFGGWSRAHAQRSLSIFARRQYGISEIEYPLFSSLEYDKFEAIVLRNAGNDWLRANFRDAMATSLMDGADIEIQAFRPVAAYLNGDYWGLYNVREKINEHFLDSKINVSKSEINLLEKDGEVIQGSADSYNELLDFINDNSLSVQANFDYISSLIDVDNFIAYQVAQIYFDNGDWPGNNIKFWNSPETKWRWILFDTDFGWGLGSELAYEADTLSVALDPDGPAWPNPPWSTFLLRHMLENAHFRNKFINYFADSFNDRFMSENVISHIESIQSLFQSEITKHYERWGNESFNEPTPPFGVWEDYIEVIKRFANNRVGFLRNHIQRYFNLSGTFVLRIKINDLGAGQVQLNSLSLAESVWEGVYFNDVPVVLNAVASEGYVFSHWSGDIDSTSWTTELNASSDTNIEAVFLPVTN